MFMVPCFSCVPFFFFLFSRLFSFFSGYPGRKNAGVYAARREVECRSRRKAVRVRQAGVHDNRKSTPKSERPRSAPRKSQVGVLSMMQCLCCDFEFDFVALCHHVERGACMQHPINGSEMEQHDMNGGRYFCVPLDSANGSISRQSSISPPYQCYHFSPFFFFLLLSSLFHSSFSLLLLLFFLFFFFSASSWSSCSRHPVASCHSSR